MKKKLICAIVGLVFTIGLTCCVADRTYNAYYIYSNQTTVTITMDCYYGNDLDGELHPDNLYKTITVFPGQNDTVYLSSRGGFCRPFGWRNTTSIDLSVDNGQERIVIHGRESASLLDEKTYTVISEKKYSRHCEYIFTDEFFKDGEPIE